MAIALLCLLIAVYFDVILLKQRNRQLFKNVFTISSVNAIFGLLSICLMGIFSEDKHGDLPPLFLLLFLPSYLLRRNQFSLIMKHDTRQSLKLLSSAVGVIVVWIYGVIVFGFVASGFMDLFKNPISQMGDLIISAIFSSILIVVLVYYSSKHFSDQGFLTNVGLRKGNRSWVKVFLLPTVFGLFFAFCSSYLTGVRQIQPQTPLSEIVEATKSLNLILAFLFLAICIAPLIEEIIFRGYFFHIIKEWIGTRKAIYVIALTFAFLHIGQYWGDWLAIVMVTLLGFTLTILRAWTGTTVASVVTHYVYNGGVTIIPIILLAVSNPAYFEYKAYFPVHDARTKETLLLESIHKRPNFVDAYNDLAWLYAQEEKNLDNALELIEKALSFAPHQPAYLDTKAEVLEKLGRLDEAHAIRNRLE